MKNKINNKLLMMATVSSILMSGCVSKTIIVPNTKVKEEKKSSWKFKNKAMAKGQKKECVDCYATVFKDSKRVQPFVNQTKIAYSYDYSKAPADVYPTDGKKEKLYSNPYDRNNPYEVDNGYEEENRESKCSYLALNDIQSNTVNRGFSKKKSIQVGAFRKYAGAKVYAKRYSLLTNKYSVDIKENVKDNEPIYRVQIEGFSTEREAENFMARYGLNGAFLVSR